MYTRRLVAIVLMSSMTRHAGAVSGGVCAFSLAAEPPAWVSFFSIGLLEWTLAVDIRSSD